LSPSNIKESFEPSGNDLSKSIDYEKVILVEGQDEVYFLILILPMSKVFKMSHEVRSKLVRPGMNLKQGVNVI